MKIPKWARCVISGVIAFLVMAAYYPSITRSGEPPHPALLIYMLCISVVPFLLVCIFAGRSKIGEGIGWGVQVILFAPIFIAILVGIFTAIFRTCP